MTFVLESINFIIGNAYLKGEFKLHQNASQIQYKEFLDQWFSIHFYCQNLIFRELYYLDLKKSDSIKKIGRNLTKEEITLLNDDQKKTLANLQSSVKKIK
jgi:hypothetical protein